MAGGSGRFEWTVAVTEEHDGIERTTQGAIDAAVFDGNGWRVLDWKTDDVDDAASASPELAYRAQVGRYAELIRQLRGEPAEGHIIRLGGNAAT